MDYHELKDYKPPDWGGFRTGDSTASSCHGPNEGWERIQNGDGEIEAGPSDYLRRAWMRGRRGDGHERDDEGYAFDGSAWDSESLLPAPYPRIENRGVGDGCELRKGYVSAEAREPVLCRTMSPQRQFSSSGHVTGPGFAGIPLSPFDIGPKSSQPGSYSASKINRKRRPRTRSYKELLPTFLLPFLPLATAAPPQSRRTAYPHPYLKPDRLPRYDRDLTPSIPAPTRRPASVPRDVQFITSAEIPSTLPTDIATLEQTALPILYRTDDGGIWTREEAGWKIYGRQAGTPAVGDGGASPSWAVEEVLPPGWGVQSTRTDFYRVPLIVISSVIIAISIVVTIIVIAFKRRKAHRRAKRRAERLRRKALAAAGLTEEDANDSQAQAQLSEKLDELQRQHRAKRKSDAKVDAASPKAKVKGWRAGLRLRRGGPIADRGLGTVGEGQEDGDGVRIESEVIGGNGAVNPAGIVVDKPDDDLGVPRIRGSNETDRSTPTVPSEERASGGSGSGSDGLGMDSMGRTATESSENTMSISDRESRDSSAPHGAYGSFGRSSNLEPGIGEGSTRNAGSGSTAPAPYFPPAYRPASVRSLSAPTPSSPPNISPARSPPPPLHPALPGAEKVRAPGYYPAPSTADGEIALAVASRSEGKQRMPIPIPPEGGVDGDEENAETTRAHLATDDKRVLERLRLAASAPDDRPAQNPGTDGETGEDQGPSAPHVEVDDSGFEALPPDLVDQISRQPQSGFGSGQPSMPSPPPLSQVQGQFHPLIPPPPQRPSMRRTWTGEVEREVHEQLDELNLLPSAPPVNLLPSAPPVNRSLQAQKAYAENDLAPTTSLPSAPPLLDEEENSDVSDGPSAPPLHLDDEDDDTEPVLGSAPPVLAATEPIEAGDPSSAIQTFQGRPAAPVSLEAPIPEAAHPNSSEDSDQTGADDPVVVTDERRPSEAPSEVRVYLPKYEP